MTGAYTPAQRAREDAAQAEHLDLRTGRMPGRRPSPRGVAKGKRPAPVLLTLESERPPPEVLERWRTPSAKRRWRIDPATGLRVQIHAEAYSRQQSANGRRRAKRRPSRPVDAREAAGLAVMKASGMRDKEIGRAMQLSPSTVRAHTSTPDALAHIERWRRLFRSEALERAQGVQGDAWARVAGSLERDDARAFDAYTRGLHAIERIAASASGENKPAVTQIAVLNQTMSGEERAELMRAFRATVIDATTDAGPRPSEEIPCPTT